MSPIQFEGYSVTIEPDFRWLSNKYGQPWATSYKENRGFWPTIEAAQAALDQYLDANPNDLSYADHRPKTS